MKNFIIEEKFWDLFPNAKLGIIVCNGINNHVVEEDKYKGLLEEAEKEAMKHLTDEEFSNNQVIKVWRDAFKQFKTKKGARASIEAMLKRVSNGNHIGTINPLVDIYNSISLRYGLPVGGEDIDKFEGDCRLTLAEGGEDFITYGSDKSEPPYEGEVVYKDDAGAICRCWNWREAVRTMLTEDTTNSFMCIELIDESRYDVFEAALHELAKLIEANLGGSCRIEILSKDRTQIVIEE